MNYKIRANEKVSYSLCERDTVKSVLQNCHLFLSTRIGTIPMYREYGLDMDFVDRPANVVQSMMIPKVREGLAVFEPRAIFVNLTFEQDVNVPGRIIPILEVEINEQNGGV